LFVTEFSKLKVTDLEELRIKLKKIRGKFLVVKNSLVRLAFGKRGFNYLAELVNGQTGVILGGNDPAIVSKILVEFSRKFPDFKIKGSLFDGQVASFKEIQTLAQLPPRPILLGKVCANLKTPFNRLIYSLGLLNKFILILKRIGERKGG